MQMKSAIYRQQALQRFSSPERIDRLLEVTGGKAWLALISLATAVAAALTWSIFGAIPINVTGNGIVQFHMGGTRAVVSQAAGMLTEVLVAPGDYVKEGQVIAHLGLYDLSQQHQNAANTVAAIENEQRQLVVFYARYLQDQGRVLDQQQQSYRKVVGDAEQRTQAQRAILDGTMKLRRSGFATLTQEQTVREKLMAAAQDHDQANANVLQVDTQRQALVNQRDEALRGVNERLINARNSLASIEELLRVGKDVRAPVSGRIIQFESQLHTFVSPGTTVALIEFGREQSSAIAYVPAIDGKLITPGMRVEVSPTTTKPEQYGSIVGTVQSVGAYPATSADMMRVLNNQTLVNTFLAGGAPLEVLVSLHQDPSTVSGLEWTSVGGPPLKITGGTIASARITVENDPPITLVVPFFRRFLGI